MRCPPIPINLYSGSGCTYRSRGGAFRAAVLLPIIRVSGTYPPGRQASDHQRHHHQRRPCHPGIRALARLDSFTAGRTLDDATLAVYLAELHDAGKSPATIGLAVAAVRFRAKLTRSPSPAGPATERVLAGARRQGAVRSPGSLGAKPMQPPRSRPMVSGPSPAFAMPQSSWSRAMPCSGSPKSPPSIAPMSSGIRTVPGASPCAGRSRTRKLAAPCSTSGRPPEPDEYRPSGRTRYLHPVG